MMAGTQLLGSCRLWRRLGSSRHRDQAGKQLLGSSRHRRSRLYAGSSRHRDHQAGMQLLGSWRLRRRLGNSRHRSSRHYAGSSRHRDLQAGMHLSGRWRLRRRLGSWRQLAAEEAARQRQLVAESCCAADQRTTRVGSMSSALRICSSVRQGELGRDELGLEDLQLGLCARPVR